jgi:SLOG cluster2
MKNGLGLKAEIICLDRDGHEIQQEDGRGEEEVHVPEGDDRRVALTSLRREMVRKTKGRILIGGKRHGFQGAFPGLVEEATMALEAKRPLYLAGGFGGITHDIAIALGLDEGQWMPRRPDEPPPDPRTVAGLTRIEHVSRQAGGVKNGLTVDENSRLAASHRPSDISALISMGLGRLIGG